MSTQAVIEHLGEVIDQSLTHGDYNVVISALSKSMMSGRVSILNYIEKRGTELPSKLKLKLFEYLIELQDEDCVPAVLALYRSETNLLYLKSMLYQLKKMPCKEVLQELLSREATMSSELQSTYGRVVGFLKNKFREIFYIEAFKAGIDSPKKTRHAAGKMIEEPHPDYIPFLCEQLSGTQPLFRVEAMRVLRETGDEGALGSMLNLLTDLLEETRISKALLGLLPRLEQPGRDLSDLFIEQLIEPLPWDHLRARGFVIRIRTNTPKGGFEALLDAYRIFHGSLRQLLLKFIKGVYLGKIKVEEYSQTKIQTLLKNFHDHRHEQMDLCLEAMGVMALRNQVDNFPDILDKHLPKDHPERKMILVKLFSGFRNEKSLGILISLLEEETHPDNLTQIAETLALYPPFPCPEKLIPLAGSLDHASLRKAALKLLGKSPDGPGELAKLMENPSIMVRVDVLGVISENHLVSCLPVLFELNDQEQPNSFLLKLVETFSEFPGNRTGEAIQKYLSPGFPPVIRLTALKTMILSGGKNRYAFLFSALEKYSDKQLQEMVTGLLEHLYEEWKRQGADEFPWQEIAKNLSLWQRMLNEVTTETVTLHFPFLMGLKWGECDYLPGWIEWTRTLQKDQIGLTLEAKKMISSLMHQLGRIMEEADESQSSFTQFASLLDHMDSMDMPVALRALRSINSSFRKDVFRQMPMVYDRLIESWIDFVERFEQDPQCLIQAMVLASKAQDPKLNRRMKLLREHPQSVISHAAHRSLMQSLGIKKDRFQIKKVLILDDSKFFCLQLKRFLEAHGFLVHSTPDIEEALSLMEQQTWDLFLLDFQMPERNGLEVFQEARRRMIAPASTLVMTNDQSRELVMSLIEEGVLQLLSKPFQMADLFGKIQHMENEYLNLMGSP